MVCVSTKIKVWYWPRRSLRKLLLQHFNYGRGRALTCSRHRCVHPRSAILIVAWLSLAGFVYFFNMMVFDYGIAARLAMGIGLAAFLVLVAANIVFSHRLQFANEIWRQPPERLPSAPKLIAVTALSLLIMYSCYPAGLVYQCGRMLLRRRASW